MIGAYLYVAPGICLLARQHFQHILLTEEHMDKKYTKAAQRIRTVSAGRFCREVIICVRAKRYLDAYRGSELFY